MITDYNGNYIIIQLTISWNLARGMSLFFNVINMYENQVACRLLRINVCEVHSVIYMKRRVVERFQ
jgi:hypothetical protein